MPFVLRECILNSSDRAIALTAFTSQKPLWNLCLSFGCFGVRVCVRDRTAHFTVEWGGVETKLVTDHFINNHTVRDYGRNP